MKLWKRTLGLFLLLAVLVLVLPTNADAAEVASGICGDDLTWVLDDAGTLTISGSGAMTDYDNQCDVPWYEDASSIKKVVIDEGITSIGWFAFYECTNLTSITIPDSVTSIGEYAFCYCKSLTSIEIPDSVTSIGGYAFGYCTSLTSVELPDGLTYVGEGMFSDCTSLTSIELPDSVTSIGWSAFSNCKGLTSIELPDSVTSIGDYVFLNCESLTSVEISDSVTSIGWSAFSNCKGLTSIEIPNSVIDLGEYAFYDCTSLTSVVISESITSIKDCTFDGCSSLTSIEIPDSVTSIGNDAFSWCSSLTSIYFQGDAPEISYYAFYYVRSAAYYPAGNETWTEDVMQNYGGSITWVAYTAAPVVKASNVASTGKIKLTWDAVEGATKYEVYRATSRTGKYTRMGSTGKTSYTNGSAKVGKTYYYYVIAVDANGNQSEKSNIDYRCCDLAQPKITLTNVKSTGKIKISWEAIEGATKYEVYRATSKNGKYTRLTTTKNLYVTNTSAVAGKTYYYKVRAICGVDSATSAFSAVGYRCCDLARPVITVTRNSSGNPVIKWAAIKGATKYEVWYATSKNGTYKKLITTTKTKVVNSSAVAGKTYYYKVRAVCGVSAATSAFSAVKYIKAK